ncbi:hypothetical protein ACSFA0_24990 [Variovorax sp. LT1P1]
MSHRVDFAQQLYPPARYEQRHGAVYVSRSGALLYPDASVFECLFQGLG